jgi:hypothetical protein
MANFDIRKTVTDAGYVTIGLGVLGFQQAQVRRRELQKRLAGTGGCLNARAADGKARLETLNDWAQELGVTVRDRIEPVVGPFVEQVANNVKTAIPSTLLPGRTASAA